MTVSLPDPPVNTIVTAWGTQASEAAALYAAADDDSGLIANVGSPRLRHKGDGTSGTDGGYVQTYTEAGDVSAPDA